MTTSWRGVKVEAGELPRCRSAVLVAAIGLSLLVLWLRPAHAKPPPPFDLMDRVNTLEAQVAALQATVEGQNNLIAVLAQALDTQTIGLQTEISNRQAADAVLQGQIQASTCPVTPEDIANWNAAFGWGDHAAAGYLTSYTETDPVFSSSPAAGVTVGDLVNWEAAYGWGDHSAAGYLTAADVPDVMDVQATLAPFTTVERPDGGYDVYLTAANLHVRNGLEATNGYPIDPESTDPAYILTNGLGNLIIGYDEAIGDRWDTATLQCVPWEESDRAGSHNIVLGINNGYPSFAGLVAGQGSYVGGPYAAVSAGQFNLADGVGTSVSGGWMNMASDSYASVSGGRENTASGPYAWVSGGHGNTADGYYASVSGGHHNAASGPSASVSGGYGRAASSNYDWAAGGLWEDQ